MDKIERVWFANNRIYIKTAKGSEKSHPLEAFPHLMDATDEQRNEFIVWADGHSIRWDNIDEDIHISSFDDTTEPNYDNEVAELLDSAGVIDIAVFADIIGIRKSKLNLFRYGIWTPSKEMLQIIKDGIRQIELGNLVV